MIEPIQVLCETEGHKAALLYDAREVTTPEEAISQSKAWLDRELGVWGADKAIRTARPAIAWWGGIERGFVQQHHDGAQEVVAVDMPDAHF